MLVDGGLAYRTQGLSPGLRRILQERFSADSQLIGAVGEESDPGATPHGVEREVEDLVAVIGATGGPANVFAHSAGAALALEAARRGARVPRMVCYEAPFILDSSHPADDPDFARHLQQLIDDGRRGEAVTSFFRLMEGARIRLLVRVLPLWKKLTGVAHTLPYEFALLGPFRQQTPLPHGYYDSVTAQTLMISGDKSYQYMRNAQPLIARALPHGRVETLPGQTHDVKPTVSPQ